MWSANLLAKILLSLVRWRPSFPSRYRCTGPQAHRSQNPVAGASSADNYWRTLSALFLLPFPTSVRTKDKNPWANMPLTTVLSALGSLLGKTWCNGFAPPVWTIWTLVQADDQQVGLCKENPTAWSYWRETSTKANKLFWLESGLISSQNCMNTAEIWLRVNHLMISISTVIRVY